MLGVDPPPARGRAALDPALEPVLEAVADAPATADELARLTGRPASVVAAALAELELLGLVEEGDGVYRLRA